MLAARRSVTQEQIIVELRQYIELNFASALQVMDVINEGTGKSSYISQPKNQYKKDENQEMSELEKKIKLNLYESQVQQMKSDAPLMQLKSENEDLTEEILTLKSSLQAQ